MLFTLDSLGYSTRHIAQEHSYVKDMWKRLTNPDVLIFLQASFPIIRGRCSNMIYWSAPVYEEQQRRLSHALAHANLIIDTDNLQIQDVLTKTLAFIGEIKAEK